MINNTEKFYQVKSLANTYKILENRYPPMDQEYVIYAYFLYSETTDGKHGKHIFLGAYPTKKKAWSEVEKIIKKTGHHTIYICEACSWEDIDEKIRPDRTIQLDPILKSKELEKQFMYDITRKDIYNKKKNKISEDLDSQQEKELDPTTIEHYAHNWYLTIKNKSEYEYHKEQMKHYEEMYIKRANKVRELYKSKPEYDSMWLEIYEKRLKYRGEENVFKLMKQGYKLLRDEIINNNT